MCVRYLFKLFLKKIKKREKNGKNDGKKAKDGYEALAQLDSNNDGVINFMDDAYNELKIWQDVNSDGITDEGELFTLEEANVSEISLTSTQSDIDSNGNTIGLESTYLDADGNVQESADVWFEYEENTENENTFIITNEDTLEKIDIDGQEGYDTLIIEEDMVLDFSSLIEESKIANIEEINLERASVTLENIGLSDVLKTEDESILRITGDADDSVELDESWSQVFKDGEESKVLSEDGETSYDVYVNDNMTLYVDDEIIVTDL